MFPNFVEYFESIKPRLDDAFANHLNRLLDGTSMRYPGTLRSALEDGKKIRGCLLCMVNESLGGIRASAIPRAVAVEFIQAASLIHDDYVDQDTVRRNKPAAWTLEGARNAVLLGDVMFATAIKMMNEVGREDGLVVADAIAQISRGALLEPLNPNVLGNRIKAGQVNGSMYERIIHLKSGHLFGAACQLGAIASGADSRLQAAFKLYGLKIGEAYQLADDIQEIKNHLLIRSIDPEQMAVLAPGLLCFSEDMTPCVLNVLEGKDESVRGELKRYFEETILIMEGDIERRLSAAVSTLKEAMPKNRFKTLLRHAPKDLIGMFNEVG